MEDACRVTLDLWSARDEWTIEADGDMTGEYDPEGDRMFNGDTLNCRALGHRAGDVIGVVDRLSQSLPGMRVVEIGRRRRRRRPGRYLP